MWDIRTAIRGVIGIDESYCPEKHEIQQARLFTPANRVIREDQLHACFLSDEPTHLGTFFAKYHQHAISAMRRMQAEGSIAGAEIEITDASQLEDFGFFPEVEPTVSLRDHWGYKALGLEGVQVAVRDEEAQRHVFRYAKLGDWMNTWENFDPLVNLNVVTERSIMKGETDKILEFYERLSELPNHGHLFRHEFDLKGPHNWPRPPDHHQEDRGREESYGLGELTT